MGRSPTSYWCISRLCESSLPNGHTLNASNQTYQDLSSQCVRSVLRRERAAAQQLLSIGSDYGEHDAAQLGAGELCSAGTL